MAIRHYKTIPQPGMKSKLCSSHGRNNSRALLDRLIGLFFVGITFLLMTSPQAGLAQPGADGTVTPSPDLQIASLEQSYDSQVINILSNYFDRTKFFVDVNINAEMVEETTTVRQNNVRQRRSPDVVMPGLPFLPEENMQPSEVTESETAINEYTVRNLRLRNIAVHIYADTSFTNDDLEFMRMIAGIAAKMNEERGDQITITQTSMPTFDAAPAEAPVDSSQVSSTSSDRLASFYQYLPGVLILLVIGLIIWITRLYSKQERDANTRPRDQFKMNNDRPEQSQMAPQKQNMRNHVDEEKGDSELEKLAEKFFTQPREIKLLFESWIEEDPGDGITKAAKVINTVDKQLIKSIKTELSDNYYTAIKEAAEDIPALTMEQKQDIAQEFNTALESNSSGSKSGKKRGHLPLLKFLKHISDDQILQLIHEGGPLAAALMLDYLSEERGAQILDQLDQDKATTIMMRMMRIRDLSYKQQKELASKLYESAMSRPDPEIEHRYNSENIIPLLERLPMEKQRGYIEQLKEADPRVGKFIQNQFITIQQIPELDDELIKEAISPINTETLLDAVIGLDESITEKLLSVRPKREQRLIRMELDQIINENEWDTDYAKSMLMSAIRQTARQFNK